MKKQNIFLILILFALFLNGCKYDFILPEEVTPIDTTKTISFATDVVTIFSTGDKCTSCHKTGGTSPDLSATNAWAQITSKVINTASPEQSKILTYAGPTTATHTWKKLTTSEAAIILAWIKDGANNN